MTDTGETTFNEKGLDFKKLFKRAVKYWYYFPIFFVAAVVVVAFYYKTTTPEYRISARLLISEGGESRSSMHSGSAENAMPGISLGLQSNFDNQTIILTSLQQIENTLAQLDFTVSYFSDELFLKKEIYNSSPFRVIIDSSKVAVSNLDFSLEFISRDQFILNLENDSRTYSGQHKFFEKIESPLFAFSVVPKEELIGDQNNHVDNRYIFKIRTRESLAGYYQGKIRLERIQSGASIVDISITESNIRKGIKFLNNLAQNSVSYTLDKKNQIATNTINFIERQLVGVMDSLSAAETVLEEFRSRNKVMDVSYQGQMIITQSGDLESQKAELVARLDYYTYLLEYVQSNRDVQDITVPSAMGVSDPILNQLIGELSTLNAERSSLQFNSSIENPNITRIDHRIRTLRNSIVENTKSIITTTNLSLNDLNNRLYQLSQQIQKLPKTEQTLLNIERRFRMNNEMYTFLLERRAEAQLAKAANMPDNEIVELARVRGQVAPDKTRSILLIFVFGLMLPGIIVFLKVYSNNKVQEEEDLTSITQKPIMGTVPFSKRLSKEKSIIINTSSHSSIAESIRNLRTSISYFGIGKQQKTILITSTIPGEGKTFIAANLASAFAQLGKSTLLIGFDLRMPKIDNKMIPSLNDNGLVHYLLGEKDWRNILQPTDYGTLNVIIAGGSPPNPSELIASRETELLFADLKKHFEVIIIDSPPIGLVSDAYLLAAYSDLTMIIARQNLTPKDLFRKNMNNPKTKQLQHVALVLNGTEHETKNYGYYYEGGK